MLETRKPPVSRLWFCLDYFLRQFKIKRKSYFVCFAWLLDTSFQYPAGAHNRNRTDDLFLTKEVLCRLSYMGQFSNK